jgi:TRAP-type C4-dicarboxylate transport system permease small subunit
MAAGGLILAVTGGFVLHLLPSRVLMITSGVGFLLSVLFFAIMPAQTTSTSGNDGPSPSNNFLFWAYVFPSMLCATIGIDITFNVTNIFITTAMPRRLQATASGLINNLLYLGVSFWLGIGELAVSATMQTRGGDGGSGMTLRDQYRIGFWTGVGLAAVALCVTATIKMAQASADMTADEKAELAMEAARLAEEEQQAQEQAQDKQAARKDEGEVAAQE